MYGAAHAIVGTLSEIKAKLILANADGADKIKIQSELAIVMEQAHAITGSAVFAGSNWLSTDEPDHLSDVAALTTQIVSAFSRHADGKVSVGAIGADLKATSMLNAGGGARRRPATERPASLR